MLYLQENKHRYDAFIFFQTYLYYPTACGIAQVADKAILFPSAHDERPIYLNWYQRVFSAPRALIMQTKEERDFVNKTFKVKDIPQRMAAMHIPNLTEFSEEEIDSMNEDMASFFSRYQLTSKYILYAGRIETAKGAIWMLQYFLRYIKETKDPISLVLIGRAYIKLPKHPQIRYLGFLSENDKRCAILGCQFFLMPSFYESLSVSLLEALGLGKPAIVNAACSVTHGHIKRSRAGFAVSNYQEFKAAFLVLLSAKNEKYGLRGVQYVHQNYTWEKVAEIYHELVTMIANPVIDKSKQESEEEYQTSMPQIITAFTVKQ